LGQGDGLTRMKIILILKSKFIFVHQWQMISSPFLHVVNLGGFFL
jgi:hypothetical protein